jgi:two-component system NtrC family sensor kinase
VHYTKDSQMPLVSGDFQQIEQVIINLLHNACDALSDVRGQKEIHIKTSLEHPFAHIVIQDNGPGIPKELHEKIFEPFFTTKAEGKGTGVGLAICKSIVQDHGGFMELESTPERGTSFRIKLPISQDKSTKAAEEPDVLPAVPGKHILLIDDEADLIPLMRQILLDDGDHIEVATDGLKGLEWLRTSTFDLVVSDMEMGAVKGLKIYEAIKEMREKPRLVFITGNILSSRVIDELKFSGVPCLSKPFSLADFRQIVRKALANPN